MSDALVIRRLREDEWFDATGLMARAFHSEPFILGLYGDDPIERYVRCVERYDTQPWPASEVVLGAFLARRLVGVAAVSPPGACHSCDVGERPDDPVALLDWEFYCNVRDSHVAVGEHAAIGRVATEPVLRGQGVGAAILAQAAEEAARLCAVTLLECEPHRVGFYERAGFRKTAVIPDPLGPPPLLMRRDR